MKLQRSTLLLVAIALGLGGIILFTQAQQSTSNRPVSGDRETAAAPVFGFEEADVTTLSIETTGQPTVAFEKDDEGFWQMTIPEMQPAEEAAIAFLLSRLTTDGLVKTTVADAANQADFGFETPFSTVELTLVNGDTHQLILGGADFSGQNYYALVDPATFPLSADSGEIEVAIVAQNILNGVDRPLDEWQAPVDEPAPAEDDEEADGTSNTDADGTVEDSADGDTSTAPETSPAPIADETDSEEDIPQANDE
ncbi:MAG: DUF4340 domain-containing protein [Leptolyngbyaceae cyanobacterium]